MRIVVGLAGSSGPIYGIRTLEVLKQLGVETHLVVSDGARRTIPLETRGQWTAEKVQALATVVYDNHDLAASISSGSFATDGMIVVPCSMKTLAGVAHGLSRSLVERAADVMLKERRPLIIVPRETPMSLPQLRNMVLCAEAGAMILPASEISFVPTRIPTGLVKAWIIGRNDALASSGASSTFV